MRIWTLVLAFGTSALAGPPTLELPIACDVGRSCFIQNYVEHKTSLGSRDYTCGTRTYAAHNGTDFRLPDMQVQRRGVNVLAAAAGVVGRVRDDVADISMRERSIDSVKTLECGNGVIITHEDGWETQYCHMQNGSLTVRPGQEVIAGQVLGRVGLSGMTEYPHLHFTVRHQNMVIDPFSQDFLNKCGGGTSLWSKKARTALAYQASEVLNVGFVPRAITRADIEGGVPALGADPPALAAFVRVIGLRQGDILKLSIVGPDDVTFAARTDTPLPRDRAEQFVLVGRKRTPSGWKTGTYTAIYEIERDGATVLQARFSHQF